MPIDTSKDYLMGIGAMIGVVVVFAFMSGCVRACFISQQAACEQAITTKDRDIIMRVCSNVGTIN